MPTILAIDPGNEFSAYVLYDGTVKEWAKVDNHFLLADLRRLMTGCDGWVIERIASYGMPVGREVFETCFWTGRFIERMWWLGDDEPALLERAKVKMHLCQSMRAKDGNVRQALIDKLGPQGTKKNPGPTYGLAGDGWAALGVAVTAAETIFNPNQTTI